MNSNLKIRTLTLLILMLALNLFLTTPSFTQEDMSKPMESNKKEMAFLLFDNYETLDVFGPAEIFGRLVDLYALKFYSMEGGLIHNRHGVSIMTQKLESIKEVPYIFFIPGGLGTRIEVNNELLIGRIKEISESSDYVLTVCTGSALLAKSGLLDGREATSNKRAFAWVTSNGSEVVWDDKARWKVDGKFYTSSGVSAGMDMSLGFLADKHGIDFARKVATEIEYNWIEDMDFDAFKAK